VVAAQDAKAVVNGITVTSPSNAVSGAIQGVTLSLAKAAPGTTTTISVTRNIAAASSAIQSFVQAYNNTAATLSTLSAYNADTKTGAILQGDSTLLGVQSRMRSALSSAVAHATGYASLSELGIAFQKDGTLLVDSTKLNAALSNPTKDAAAALAAVGTPSDSLVSFGGASAAALPGNFAVLVTRLAARGAATGSAPAALTITAGVNDTLALSVDGIAASVTLAAGTYSASGLSAMLQSRINASTALSTAGSGIEAGTAGGVLTLTSRKWGSASGVTITGGTAAADLFSGAASTTGVDAAGSIGGVAATGSGQSLTAQGLTVGITGGVTGARGTLNFSRGIADTLGTLVTNVLTTTLAARTSGLQTSITDLAVRRAAFETRMTDVEAAMRAQFSALDTTMNSMQNTSSFLTQQLAALNKTTTSG
jgi:flagellar hook-associated protein 2